MRQLAEGLTRIARLILVVFAVGLSSATLVLADDGDFVCAAVPDPGQITEITPCGGPSDLCYCVREAISATSNRRALVVYVKFADDTTNWYAGSSPSFPCYQYGWSKTRGTNLPQWADSLLSTSSTPGTLGVAGQLGMSNYYYQMSDSAHWLYGDVYNRLHGPDSGAVVVPADSLKNYPHFAAVNRAILHAIDPYVNFANYDTNPVDGIVDQVFMIYRFFYTAQDYADSSKWFLNAEGAGATGFASLGISDTVRTGDSGVYLCSASGATLRAPTYMFTLAGVAHEYGHRIIGLYPDGGGPLSFHLPYEGKMGLMDGSGGGLVMSAYERWGVCAKLS